MSNLNLMEVMKHFSNSQSELARQLNVSRQAVSKWFEKNKIPLLRQYQIKDILNNMGVENEDKKLG